jgi:ABC-2 type transport system ATP-binding protein
MLELCHVRKRFSGISAMDDVSFAAVPGEVTGALGPNGSGESAPTRMITGLLEPTAGESRFHGKRIHDDMVG